ncbi:polysaccharide biosynthesis/export family protein [Ichthyenterobacterium sp. W332]|uniref:Polysaccharide biosynthesis/export family protein n=1 Tax=Microcosmobacter mediterraneus TaxID=3075607 RepID=A0ABU2YMI3_9FLAO|nr:polysaccharide biosynthesis/export family protein [Ichthyenterobacterium sp. W332]MDT0559373.1 polysaccharide biosynthesis/export family protein [Ichthyenterobacterium sp. W332]
MRFLLLILLSVIFSSCASKKEVLYFQDAKEKGALTVSYKSPTIQPNDILDIKIETLVPEVAIPYNKGANSQIQTASIDLLMLNGYLVSTENTINFPVLGEISVKGITTKALESKIKKLLEEGKHLINPGVYIRILNAKVTILGEVNAPGTYNFTEQNINILQALGYANDLTINGVRDDVMIIREVDGIRTISHLDLTSAELLNNPYYTIQPNDIIYVNQNNPKVKTAGFVGNVGTVLTIASLALSVTILLTR